MYLFVLKIILLLTLNFNNIYQISTKCIEEYIVNNQNYKFNLDQIYDYREDKFYINIHYVKLNNRQIASSSTLPLITIKKEKHNSHSKVIYLTFDDGPSKLTLDILKVLDEHKVKATFFVVGNKVKQYPEITKEIREKGHILALHSYSHDYKKIYSDYESFINEMEYTQNLIYDVTKYKSYIIRFPGGSYKRLNMEFYNLLKEKNYRIYDWNISCGDGIGKNKDVETIYKNATDYGTHSRIILLMHCRQSDNATLCALPKIIEFYKKEGFKFETLDKCEEDYIFPFK
ncbi:polysaccharide deacetylase family protein [Caloramator sp. ALD01]|uniref:polysaccharide deacetylase family protein n=1 Tax=Caloramator sp. ALD01 TaxID=1031288 RepID=UPI0003FA47CC|nr:polysaccharide deacetylase family protein [Caloramator sp. ALD01]